MLILKGGHEKQTDFEETGAAVGFARGAGHRGGDAGDGGDGGEQGDDSRHFWMRFDEGNFLFDEDVLTN